MESCVNELDYRSDSNRRDGTAARSARRMPGQAATLRVARAAAGDAAMFQGSGSSIRLMGYEPMRAMPSSTFTTRPLASTISIIAARRSGRGSGFGSGAGDSGALVGVGSVRSPVVAFVGTAMRTGTNLFGVGDSESPGISPSRASRSHV